MLLKSSFIKANQFNSTCQDFEQKSARNDNYSEVNDGCLNSDSIRVSKQEASSTSAQFRFNTILISLLYASLQFGPNFDVSIGIKLRVFDFVFGAVLFITIALMIIRGDRFITLTKAQIWSFFLFYCYLLVETWNLTKDSEFPQNITLIIGVFRCILVLLFMSQVPYDKTKLIHYIVNIGCAFCLFAIIAFGIWAVPYYQVIIKTPDLWSPGTTWALREAGVLSLSGLQEDPNFFFQWQVGSILGACYLYVHTRQPAWLVKALIIGAALILTFSRSGLLILGIILLINGVRCRKKLISLVVKPQNFIVLAILCAIALVGNQSLKNQLGINIQDAIAIRSGNAISTGGGFRFDLWEVAWQGFMERPILGQGGKYTLRKIGKYVHNDFLEMLASEGIVGFSIMVALYLFVIIVNFRTNFRSGIGEVYIWTCVFSICCSMFFTIFYAPNIWFWAFSGIGCASQTTSRQTVLSLRNSTINFLNPIISQNKK